MAWTDPRSLDAMSDDVRALVVAVKVAPNHQLT
jgi:hypothetical protein